jgi:radical SAM protein with 4Fe4S-binding SPASM domain
VLEQTGAAYGWHCSPIPDIDLQGNVMACFPLGERFSVRLEEDSRSADLRAQLGRQMQPYRQAGVYPACSTCEQKANERCSGGCLAATMRRFRQA